MNWMETNEKLGEVDEGLAWEHLQIQDGIQLPDRSPAFSREVYIIFKYESNTVIFGVKPTDITEHQKLF